MHWIDIGLIVLFLAIIFTIGTKLYKWIGEPDDFYVSGRNLTPFILAATLTATNVNMYSFVGQSGMAYKYGIPIIWHTWTGNMAMVFAGLFVLPILRRLRIRTIPEYLEMRFSKNVRSLVGFIWTLRLSFWLGVVLYTGVVAAKVITGIDNTHIWVAAFSVVIIIYTMIGGMWAVALIDSLQLVLMIGSGLILLPITMHAVGWWPSFITKIPNGFMDFVVPDGPFNWVFIIVMLLLGVQWACTDQGLIQRAFGAKDVRTVAKSLILAGIITTPFAFFWNIPGIAANIIYPSLGNAEDAVPMLIKNLLPVGVMGLAVCGLFASQTSTLDANLNASATVFINDIYHSIYKRDATPKQILFAVRTATVGLGIFMIVFSYIVPYLGGAVQAYLTVVSIFDMPLFVIAIIYGLHWKRTNWQGALGGYIAGIIAGIIAFMLLHYNFKIATFFSGGAALLFCPLVTLFTQEPPADKINTIWNARKGSKEEELSGDLYSIIPKSSSGRFVLILSGVGLIVFIIGVLLGHYNSPYDSLLALSGMALFFLSALARTYCK